VELQPLWNRIREAKPTHLSNNNSFREFIRWVCVFTPGSLGIRMLILASLPVRPARLAHASYRGTRKLCAALSPDVRGQLEQVLRVGATDCLSPTAMRLLRTLPSHLLVQYTTSTGTCASYGVARERDFPLHTTRSIIARIRQLVRSCVCVCV